MPPKEVCVDFENDKRLQSTHLVRLNVIGLTGIEVDRSNVRSSGLKRAYPRPPSKMKAVIAVSRGQEIKATTPLSQPLRRPPSDMGNVSIDATSKSKRRHLALWCQNNAPVLGTLIEFEVSLDRLDVGDGQHSSSQYIPKSFEVIAGLTEATEHERKVAVPIGIANLPITGNNNGEIVALDLPLLSLSQANPLGNDKNGLKGFQMMSIHDKECGNNGETKKKNLSRLLSRSAKESSQRIPSVAERRIFSSVYSTDGNGDAMLRVQMQVIEKMNPEDDEELYDGDNGNGVVMILRKSNSQESYQDDSESERPEDDSFFDNYFAHTNISPTKSMAEKKGMIRDESITTASLTSDGSPVGEMSEHESPIPQILRSGTDADDPSINLPALDADYMADDDRSHSMQRGTEPPTTFSKQRKIKRTRRSRYFSDFLLQTCGTISPSDDVTLMSGDFFGQEFRFPICASLKDRLNDNTFLNDDIGESLDQESHSDQGGSTVFTSNTTREIQDRVGEVLARAEKALSRCVDNGDNHDDAVTMESSVYVIEKSPPKNHRKESQEDVAISEQGQSKTVDQKSSDEIRLERIQKAEQKFREEKRRNEERQRMKKSIAAVLNCTLATDVTQKERRAPAKLMKVPKSLVIADKGNEVDIAASSRETKAKVVPIHRKHNDCGFPLPAAFGGRGFCSRVDLVDDKEIVTVMTLTEAKSTMNSRSMSQLTEGTDFGRDDHDYNDDDFTDDDDDDDYDYSVSTNNGEI